MKIYKVEDKGSYATFKIRESKAHLVFQIVTWAFITLVITWVILYALAD